MQSTMSVFLFALSVSFEPRTHPDLRLRKGSKSQPTFRQPGTRYALVMLLSDGSSRNNRSSYLVSCVASLSLVLSPGRPSTPSSGQFHQAPLASTPGVVTANTSQRGTLSAADVS